MHTNTDTLYVCPSPSYEFIILFLVQGQIQKKQDREGDFRLQSHDSWRIRNGAMLNQKEKATMKCINFWDVDYSCRLVGQQGGWWNWDLGVPKSAKQLHHFFSFKLSLACCGKGNDPRCDLLWWPIHCIHTTEIVKFWTHSLFLSSIGNQAQSWTHTKQLSIIILSKS